MAIKDFIPDYGGKGKEEIPTGQRVETRGEKDFPEAPNPKIPDIPATIGALLEESSEYADSIKDALQVMEGKLNEILTTIGYLKTQI